MSQKMPTRVRGVVYESLAAASRAIGISVPSLRQAIDRGTEDYAGLGKNHRQKRPIIIDGVRYESFKDAADACGMTRQGMFWIAKLAQRNGGSVRRQDIGLVELVKKDPGAGPG